MIACCGRPAAASFCDRFAYIVPTMRAKRSQKSARCGSPSRRRSLVRQAPCALGGLFFLFPGAANFFRPTLVAVPIVKGVGNRPVATAGLVEVSRHGAGFENARLRARSPAVHSGVSRLILNFAH